MTMNDTRKKRSENSGTRAEFREMIKDVHFLYPRKHRLGRSERSYLDGHMAERPLFGIRSLGYVSENMLHDLKFGPRNHSRNTEVAVTAFYAAVRRFMAEVLTDCSVGSRIRGRRKDRFAKRYLKLCEEGLAAKDMMASGKSVVLRLGKSDVDLLTVVLSRCRDIIPGTSKLAKFLA